MSRTGNENGTGICFRASDKITCNMGILDNAQCASVHRELSNSNRNAVTGDFHGEKIQGSGEEGGAYKKRKLLDSCSSLWDHFYKLGCPKGNTQNVPFSCKYCEAEFEVDPVNLGTNGGIHRCGFCEEIPHEVATNLKRLNMQKSFLGTGNDAEDCASLWKNDDVRVWKAFCTMVIVDDLPFKYIETESFKNIMSVFCPQFDIPSKESLAKGIFQIYRDEKLKFKSFLKESSQRVCISIDKWTSAVEKMEYMCLTIHFIDNDWKPHKKVLNFRPITSLKDEEVVKVVTKCLGWWGIESIFTITVDCGFSSNVVMSCLKKRMIARKTSILSNQYVDIRCTARTINGAICRVLKLGYNEEAIAYISRATRYVKSSSDRYEAFFKCAELERKETNNLLLLGVRDRWDSTYLMLEAAIRLQKALVSLVESDENFKKHLSGYSYQRVPSNDHWKVAKLLVKFMSHFYDTTLRICGSSYVTYNSVFHEVCALELLLKEWSESGDKEISKMGADMKQSFDSYWGSVEKRNKILYYAVILDPRYKLEFLEYCFDKMYDDVTSEKMKKEVKEGITSLFDEYKGMYDDVECRSNSVSSTSSSSSNAAEPSLLQEFMKIKNGDNSKHVNSELDKYLVEEVEIENEENDNFNILLWWKVNVHRYPILSKIARDVLAVPVCSVTSESAFSTSSCVLDAFKSSMLPKTVEALVCAKDWLCEFVSPVCIEDICDANWLERELMKLSVVSNTSPLVD